MHFVARDAGEVAAAKTGRRLHPVKLASSHANHAVAPESIPEKIGLGAVDEFFLFGMVRRVWLSDKALGEIVRAGTKSGAASIKIELVAHAIESPDAVTLAAGKR